MTEAAAKPRRWDPVVRITHWSIALAVLANAIITKEGSAPHIWVGYGLAAILGLRLLWGLVGPAEARFAAFWPSPRKAIAHLREIRSGTVTRHPSHNPLGAMMIYAIWGCLLTIIATGIAMAGAPPLDLAINEGEQRVAYEEGARADQDEEHANEESSGEQNEVLEEVHKVAANLLYLLILLHLAGVLFETRRSGRQVLVAMSPLHR